MSLASKSSAFEPGARRLRPGAPPVDIIAVHSGAGAGDARTAFGPAALSVAGALVPLEKSGLAAGWTDVGYPPKLYAKSGAAPRADGKFRAVLRAARQTALAAGGAVRRGGKFLVLGGDHSIATGTWSGAANALGGRGPLGLVWIDAHMDSHTPATSPSGNWHGMPLAHLLGAGAKELVALATRPPALEPAHVCLLGVRSFEAAEADFLARLGVRVISMAQMHGPGVAAAIADAIGYVSRGTAGFGVSIDLDAIDPSDAPGVGLPVPGGMAGAEVAAALAGIAQKPGFLGLELAEYNPARDQGGKTLNLIRAILSAVFATGERS